MMVLGLSAGIWLVCGAKIWLKKKANVTFTTKIHNILDWGLQTRRSAVDAVVQRIESAEIQMKA
jgi:hypothetical protein